MEIFQAEFGALPADWSIWEIIGAALTMFLGATALSAIGFGIGMIGTPGVLLAMGDPQLAVILPGTIGAFIGVWIVVQSRKDIPYRSVLPIAVAGVLGAPIGVTILRFADPSLLRVGIATLILVFVPVSFLNFQRELPHSTLLGPAAGFVAGALLPSFGIGGQLVMLFLLTRNWRRQSVRAAMAFFLMSVTAMGITGFAVAGLYTVERLALIAIVTPPSIAGLALGGLLIKRMSERFFRYIIIAIIVVSSLVVIGRELLPLI